MSDSSEDAPQCRICHTDMNEASDPLIHACNCKGSLAWVHGSCLVDWFAKRLQSRPCCEICQFQYNIERSPHGTVRGFLPHFFRENWHIIPGLLMVLYTRYLLDNRALRWGFTLLFFVCVYGRYKVYRRHLSSMSQLFQLTVLFAMMLIGGILIKTALFLWSKYAMLPLPESVIALIPLGHHFTELDVDIHAMVLPLFVLNMIWIPLAVTAGFVFVFSYFFATVMVSRFYFHYWDVLRLTLGALYIGVIGFYIACFGHGTYYLYREWKSDRITVVREKLEKQA